MRELQNDRHHNDAQKGVFLLRCDPHIIGQSSSDGLAFYGRRTELSKFTATLMLRQSITVEDMIPSDLPMLR